MNRYKEFWSLHNNQLAKELLGIDKFHQIGYTGSRVNVGNVEKCNIHHKYFNGQIHDITNTRNRNDLGRNWHGDKTNLIQLAVAPDSNIFLINTDRSGNSDDNFIKTGYNIIKHNNISILTNSIAFTQDGGREPYLDDLFNNHNFKMTISSGNNTWNKPSLTGPKEAYYVSGSHLTSKGEFFTPDYATKGRPIRAINSYVPLYTPSLTDNYEIHYEQGTSFSSPFFAGMLALVDDFFIDKVGRPLNYKEMLKFIDDNKSRIEDVNGEPNYIFVLPNPNNIDVDKYILKNMQKPMPKPEVKPANPEEVDEMDFKDVEQHRWYTKAVEFVSKKGYMEGYKDGTFQPNKSITRAEMAQILYNIMK